ncbi:pantetheine-phosphate adenylyltransferase [Alicyclobacillus fastidiosus]|uniref:Phosphopantetheine adenylyltransferase n=1 Tax=Alicyclobacillus fastidiosus TaxID=392011 RepID=A0ABV5AGZ2_9BACL|nr:pantetheine-phosphate adenylyltransferase [Alicyclobacillus fastidiosus]WEH08066.1 pantetheine-phosphate adenylyltransferase [Alicyclobacillus fastidiosus]
MRRAMYPGTFDPITNGHLDILRHVTGLFDEVIVGILHNPSKSPLFTVDERVRFVLDATKRYPNVRVDSFSGLLVDYCRANSIPYIVRGIRNPADLQVEMQMAQMNESIYPDIHTLFIPTSPTYSFVSSSLVKDVAMHGGSVGDFVTDVVREALADRLARRG